MFSGSHMVAVCTKSSSAAIDGIKGSIHKSCLKINKPTEDTRSFSTNRFLMQTCRTRRNPVNSIFSVHIPMHAWFLLDVFILCNSLPGVYDVVHTHLKARQ